MENIKNIYTLKIYLKNLSIELSKIKKEIKELQKKGEYAGLLQCGIIGKRQDYRFCHIAYCLMRGRTYEQIELKCAENNKPDMDYVGRIINEHTSSEDVRACA